jgi:uroporphyrinogen-III decarboxylase
LNIRRPPIQWRFAFPVEVQCEYARIPQDAYYTDLDEMIRVCDIFPERFSEATGYRPQLSYAPPRTAYEGVAALGGDIVFARDHQPMIRNQGRILATSAQVDTLAVPDPWHNKRFLQSVAWQRELELRFPGQIGANNLAGQEGPVTTAGLLRGQDFFLDCLADPQRAHRLLDVCTETYIRFYQASDAANNNSDRQTIGIADDYAGLIKPDMWPEFVLPYYQRIIAALGPQGCHMHTELVRREHLPLLRSLKLCTLNFGEDQYLSAQDALTALPGIPFGWHILTVAEMQQGTPESIRRRFLELVDVGVSEIISELTVNTPLENMRAFIEIGREFEAG